MGAFAAWGGIIVAVIAHLHSNRKTAMQEMEKRIMEAVDIQSTSSARAHAQLTEQVKDMAEQMRAGYVDRREFDVTVRTMQASITQVGRDIGSVGNRVDAVGRRVDELMHWRGPRGDC